MEVSPTVEGLVPIHSSIALIPDARRKLCGRALSPCEILSLLCACTAVHLAIGGCATRSADPPVHNGPREGTIIGCPPGAAPLQEERLGPLPTLDRLCDLIVAEHNAEFGDGPRTCQEIRTLPAGFSLLEINIRGSIEYSIAGHAFDGWYRLATIDAAYSSRAPHWRFPMSKYAQSVRRGLYCASTRPRCSMNPRLNLGEVTKKYLRLLPSVVAQRTNRSKLAFLSSRRSSTQRMQFDLRRTAAY